MKMFTKKITISVLSMVIAVQALVPAAPALAAAFNTVPGDHPTLQASNYSQNPGSNSAWSGSVSANQGEIVSFVLYYYNTATDAANNTFVRAQLPSGTFTSATVTGDVRANNAPTVTGTVSVNLTSAQPLSFIPVSVKWYPNQSTVAQPLLNGQTGNEIIANGLYIGDIAPEGWGTVVFRAQVGTATAGVNNPNQPFSGSVPAVSTNSAISVSQNYATLQGTVNPNNSNTTAWFEYGTTQSFGSTAGYQTVGNGNGTISISGYTWNLAPNTTYYYRTVAQNAYGMTYGNAMTFTTQSSAVWNNGSAPSAYTNSAYSITGNAATFSGSVTPNNGYTNAWFEYGLNQSLGYTAGYQTIGSGNSASAITSNVSNLAPNTTYYYRIVAQNSYGTVYGTIVSFATNGASSNISGNAPYVTSRAAQSVFRNSALISGSVNPNGSLSTAWFEWGLTTALGNRTMVQPVGQANYADSYSAVLSGLQAGTTYYYRAVAQNGYGTTYGNVLNFITTANAIVPVVVNDSTPEPRIIVQQISGSAAAAPTVILTPSIDNTSPRAGETIKYSIQYRNEGSKAITNATLKVILPSEVEYDSATLKPSASEDNELTFDLGTVKAKSQGVITIKAKIASNVEADSALMFSATLNYTDAKKQFQSTSAYLTVMVEAGTAGLASLISVLGNLLNNWFVDLVLGLLIGFGIYHFFVRQKEEEVLIK